MIADIAAIILAGCASSSPALLSLYLVSLAYGNSSISHSTPQANPEIVNQFNDSVVNGALLEIRTGYLSLCVKFPDGFWDCRRNAMTLAEHLRPEQDPLNLLWQSQKFRDNIVFYPLLSVSLNSSLLTCLD